MGDQRFRTPVDLGDQIDGALERGLPMPPDAITEQAAGIVAEPYRGLVNRTNLISGFQYFTPCQRAGLAPIHPDRDPTIHLAELPRSSGANHGGIISAIRQSRADQARAGGMAGHRLARARHASAIRRDATARITVLAPCNMAASTVFLVRTSTIASWNPAAKSATGNPCPEGRWNMCGK